MTRSNTDLDKETDELRAKVDRARERMDQLRESLSDTVTSASNTLSLTQLMLSQIPLLEPAATTAEAQAVRIENVESHDQEGNWRATRRHKPRLQAM